MGNCNKWTIQSSFVFFGLLLSLLSLLSVLFTYFNISSQLLSWYFSIASNNLWVSSSFHFSSSNFVVIFSSIFSLQKILYILDISKSSFFIPSGNVFSASL